MRCLFLAILVFLAACAGDSGSGEPGAAPTGRGEIDYTLVQRHAEQFDVDLPSRPPGSQQELAAATYILGHLQLAGYSPVLDAIPVGNQVQSSNVIAVPPNGDAPQVVVTVAYDTLGERVHTGTEIGLFLELARAINVAEPDHAIAFAALGAEGADARGSIGLASFFEEQGLDPSVLSIRTGARESGQIRAAGSCATTSFELTPFEECVAARLSGDPFSQRGFRHTLIEGDTDVMGRSLFEFLLGAGD
ncbi:MAG: hypothetical protein ACRDKT_14560 [Actinomycetota bacterium]